jgi:hypothetical protein
VVLAGYKPTPAEEMEGIHNGEQKVEGKKDKEGPGTPPHSPPQKEDTISEPQRKRFFAIAKGTGASNEDIQAWLKTNYGFDHSKDIPWKLYDEICKGVVEFFSARQPGDE